VPRTPTEILTKNIALYSIACIMYMVCGYAIMYGGDIFLSGIAGGETYRRGSQELCRARRTALAATPFIRRL
jgi:ammonia channel protein AmtB